MKQEVLAEGFEKWAGLYDSVPGSWALSKALPTVEPLLWRRDLAMMTGLAKVELRKGYGLELDSRVERVMKEVPRHLHVHPKNVEKAASKYAVAHFDDFDDFIANGLGIDPGSLTKEDWGELGRLMPTASMPVIVALTLHAALEGRGAQGRVLDIGCGRGYQTKLLRRLGFEEIHAIDIQRSLAYDAARMFGEDSGVTFHVGDARVFKDAKKFDLVVSGIGIPDEVSLKQLMMKVRVGGRLVAPVFESVVDPMANFGEEEAVERQFMMSYTKLEYGRVGVKNYGEVLFPPMLPGLGGTVGGGGA